MTGLEWTIGVVGFWVLLAAILCTDKIADVLRKINGSLCSLYSALDGIHDILNKEPPVKLSDLAISKIRAFAKRPVKMGPVNGDPTENYQSGLADGVTEFAKFLESELTEEESA
jgi:hypothetical protein